MEELQAFNKELKNKIDSVNLFEKEVREKEQLKEHQKDPEEIQSLKQKIEILEKRSVESNERFMKLANEKDRLMKSYEKMLDVQRSEEGDGKRFTSENITELKKGLEQIIGEKDELEKDLIMEREQKEKFATEVQNLEKENSENQINLKEGPNNETLKALTKKNEQLQLFLNYSEDAFEINNIIVDENNFEQKIESLDKIIKEKKKKLKLFPQKINYQ